MIKYEGNRLCVLMSSIFTDLTLTNTFEMKQLIKRAFKNGLWLYPHDRLGGFIWTRVHVRVKRRMSADLVTRGTGKSLVISSQ